MAVVQGQLWVTYEQETEDRCPIYQSHILQTDRRFGHPKPEGVAETMEFGYRVVHGFWPHNEEALEQWVDTIIDFDMRGPNGERVEIVDGQPKLIEDPGPFDTAPPLTSSPDSSSKQDSPSLSYSG